ncbi:MAG: NAD(P)-dependent alcohol dehydrogenase [Mobiluncus porci]|uniref:NAD(P)-dependent alcohol dehydrogenase n=1 Tax=Mobiluncus porci TaxID=2652278 RepID=UPI0023F1D403|nr:NAD(P)-dependent alcohol dehydrogenase [Mobiluncus porci]MDD7541387.1 NAD(P)-dependent alcohol dehydrogenase [Mobiluncus porci]MDY5747870.1 NAD(P)-dependent alcohol dehydrogenase [Mobiluncus porci]
MTTVKAYAMDGPTSSFHPVTLERREPGPTEIYFEIKYAGICHSDIHTGRGEWGPAIYPLTPGHEIAGIVTKIGTDVTKFAVGDRVGVGCFVDSCGHCETCQAGFEQFCQTDGGTIWTYNNLGRDGLPTAGGYSQGITVEQDYVCRIPDSLGLDVAAPIMCAGITLYSPLTRWGAGPGKKVAIVGMGGLGHMGVQIAAALGAETHVISRTRSKEADALRFGAVELHPTSEDGTWDSMRGVFDLIVSTLSDGVELDDLLACVKPQGVVAVVGLPEQRQDFAMSSIVQQQKILAGSNIGGIAKTQEVLDFCAEHNIAPQIEVISGDKINEAWDNVVDAKVRYRYVIDTATF